MFAFVGQIVESPNVQFNEHGNTKCTIQDILFKPIWGPQGHKVIQLKRKKVQTIVVIYKIKLCTPFVDVAARESIQ